MTYKQSDANEIYKTVYCHNRNGEKVKCEILDKRVTSQYGLSYYIHYEGTDKRMDEWVSADRLERINDFSITKKKPRKSPTSGRSKSHNTGHAETFKIKNIDLVYFGNDVMEAWYFSPIPIEFKKDSESKVTVYFCDFCLSYFAELKELEYHYKCCKIFHPPGNEIYRSVEKEKTISVFEIDGEIEVIYSQNLCYLSKLFLDHKTLYFDTVPFLFYILTEITNTGCRFIGYFSKEKFSELGYNLACIMTLPCHQKRGYGNFLISLSYELSKIENKIGTPERPLSDLGEATYKKYWFKKIAEFLLSLPAGKIVSLQSISESTFFKIDDIVSTLEKYKALTIHSDDSYSVEIDTESPVLNFTSNPNHVKLCDSFKIHWVPYKNNKNRQNY